MEYTFQCIVFEAQRNLRRISGRRPPYGSSAVGAGGQEGQAIRLPPGQVIGRSHSGSIDRLVGQVVGQEVGQVPLETGDPLSR